MIANYFVVATVSFFNLPSGYFHIENWDHNLLNISVFFFFFNLSRRNNFVNKARISE